MPPTTTTPVIHNGVEEQEVEKILDSWMLCGKSEYLVCWKGYGVEEDKWHPVLDVQGSKQLVAEFHHTHPQAGSSPLANIVHWDAAPLKGG